MYTLQCGTWPVENERMLSNRMIMRGEVIRSSFSGRERTATLVSRDSASSVAFDCFDAPNCPHE